VHINSPKVEISGAICQLEKTHFVKIAFKNVSCKSTDTNT